MKDQLRQHPLNEGTHLLLYSIYDDILISLDLIIKNNQHQFNNIPIISISLYQDHNFIIDSIMALFSILMRY